jgi:DNA cross-link repair 1A protein
MQGIDLVSKICSRKVRLNELYLDTTYCDPKYDFPAQRDSIDAALMCAEAEGIEKNDKTLFVFGAYTIGKEKIFVAVAKAFGKKIWVDARREKILKTFFSEEDAKMLTRDRGETNVWVVSLGQIVNKGLKEILDDANRRSGGGLRGTKYQRIVGFRPSGWTYSGKSTKKKGAIQTTLAPTKKSHRKVPEIVAARKSGVVSIYGVPYSEHSSFSELVDCLMCLQPQNIVPTVSADKSREQVTLLLDSCRALIKEEKDSGMHDEEDAKRRNTRGAS